MPLAEVRAREASLCDADELQQQLAVHDKRLEKILKTNGYKQVPVPEHWDCLFTSALMQLTYSAICADPVLKLWTECSTNLQSHKDFYGPFIGWEISAKLLSDIKQKGCWNNGAMDIMAYILSNVLQCNIMLFRRRETPFVSISATAGTQNTVSSKFQTNAKQLVFACRMIKEKEHYEREQSTADRWATPTE